MNNIYLPELKSIELKNFSLYPNGLDFKNKFVEGVNLIVGGNGMGKTTFVNIIKYAIIGHYKESFDYTRTYMGKKIEKRVSLSWNYFKNRVNKSIKTDDSDKVKISFLVDNTEFTVERGLSEIELLDVKVDGKKLVGELISQKQYDQLFYDHSQEKNDEAKKKLWYRLKETLQFKYERVFEQHSNMHFDDLIFFVNKVLFFGEDHQSVLWNEGKNDVQEELFNKYFNDPDLNLERQEANRQAQYFDTQARHRSEDIRVIKEVLERVKGEDTEPTRKDKLRTNIEDLKETREKISRKLDSIQSERSELDHDIRVASNRANELSIKASEIEAEQKKTEIENLKGSWVTLHKNYHSFLNNLSTNQLCPLCSQELEDSYVEKKLDAKTHCILCDQTINEESTRLKLDKGETEKLDRIYNSIHKYQHEIYDFEARLEDLDSKFKENKKKLRRINTKIRNSEFELIKKEEYEQNKSDEKDNLQAFFDEIEELESKKEEFQEKSKKHKKRADEISNKIEEVILKNTQKFSSIFSGYAEKFLGVKCSLTFDSIKSKKRFFPVIDGITREFEEELSESQRFFVDHSFRMSILSFFYNSPSFYIAETPDSSLDISYERNAADVFMKFLENPYCLIITSNLNNSEFLRYLTKEAPKVSMINLMEIGEKSPIQEHNKYLSSIINELEETVNEKSNP